MNYSKNGFSGIEGSAFNKASVEANDAKEDVKTAPQQEEKDKEKDKQPVNTPKEPEKKEETPMHAPTLVTAPKKYARVLCDLCNIRKAPLATAEILRTAPCNEEFEFVADQNGYARVVADGTEAFIRKDLVKIYSK